MAKLTLLLAAAIGVVATQSTAQFECPASTISVIADPNVAPLICDLASRGIAELSACSLPLNRVLQIEIVETLPHGCVGQYHCGQDRIELLSQEAAQHYRGADFPFSQIDPDVYFYSVLVHELTHAALEDMPCRFTRCFATQEYVAYAMQMRSLPAEARATLLTRPEFNRPIDAYEINKMIVLMAPGVFLQKAWWHFIQQDDPCAFIGQVVSGAVSFDREYP